MVEFYKRLIQVSVTLCVFVTTLITYRAHTVVTITVLIPPLEYTIAKMKALFVTADETDNNHFATLPQFYSSTKKLLPQSDNKGYVTPSLDTPQIYTDRKAYMYQKCAELSKGTHSVSNPNYFYSNSNNVAFCKAPKTGSTFIGIVVKALEYRKVPKRDIFYINREIVHSRKTATLNTVTKQGMTLVLVTRDPFTRLFSAYLDKYYLLGIWGREMAKNIGKGHRKIGGGYCGFNISFEEFLDYVTAEGMGNRREDRHTIPVSSLCDPCSVRYDVICKQETLTADVEHILEVINVTKTKRQTIIEHIHSKSLKDTIFSWISSHIWYFNVFREDCSDKVLFMDRVWRVLQFQGYINASLTFPVSLFQKLSVFTAETVTSFILNATMSSPLTESQTFLQRKRALWEAYGQIKPTTIARVREKFANDFRLFGYDMSPPCSVQ